MSVTDSVLEPPLNVGVAPTTLLPCSIVRLCGTIDELVNVIVTFPAFAVSDDCVNFSAPLGSAACVRVLPPLAGAADDDDDEADDEADVELAGAADDAVLLLLLLDPHAARPSASDAIATAMIGSRYTIQVLLWPLHPRTVCGADSFPFR